MLYKLVLVFSQVSNFADPILLQQLSVDKNFRVQVIVFTIACF